MAVFQSSHVAELQGLYGPFTMAERVVQKIWLREDFAQDGATLTDGRPLIIRSTGAWNLLAGPDFLGARLVIDGVETAGDIEVHFHASDWRAHGHATDRAYDNVVLHVVLFPPAMDEPPARHDDGREIPTLVLLPLLHRDLEEYASDDALEIITARDEWECFAELAALPASERLGLIREHAGERWRQKVRYAQLRIDRLGWTAAAHHTALEILGYRQNRAAMLAVAGQHPLPAWVGGLEPEVIFEAGRGRWQLRGVRPANHPLTRLRQYQRWVAMSPAWPERLEGMVGLSDSPAVILSRAKDPVACASPAGSFARLRMTNEEEAAPGAMRLQGIGETPTREARRELGIKRLRETFADLVGASVDRHDAPGAPRDDKARVGPLGGSRLDNLVCDGFLPLLAARTGRDLSAVWFHWFLGDVPDQVRRALPKLGVTGGRGQPMCHGCAQGLIGWLLTREARASG